MALGGGKYADLCEYVMQQSKAGGAIVIVVSGNKGSGFSCQLTLEGMATMPEMLRWIADEIEKGGGRA